MEGFVTRQQIRAINRKLFANEMIYNSENTDDFITLVSGIISNYNPEDEMASTPTVLEIKEGMLKDKEKAKVLNAITLLDPKSVMFQVNSKVFASTARDAVLDIRNLGYQFIVEINADDQVFFGAKTNGSYIKFDIHNIPKKLADAGLDNKPKIAYNVDSAEDFTLAEAANIDYYEGTYISPKTNIEIEDSQHSEVNFIELMALMNKEDTDTKDLANVIQRDSLMSAQIIRLSNSAYFGGRTRIESINDAIVRVGFANLKKWVFLLQFSRHNDVPEELLQTSYHRAIFCEAIQRESKNKEIKANEAYLVGLFSTLDALTGKPVDEQIAKMNLSPVIEDALIYRDGIGGTLLNLTRAYEEANWGRVERYLKEFKLNKDKIFKIYFSSLESVAELWKSLTELGGAC